MKGANGFTTIELVMVIAILALVAGSAWPELRNLPNTRAYDAVRKLRSDIRYAQLLAIEAQARTQVVFDSGLDKYSVQREASPNNWVAVVHPSSRADYEVQFNSGNYARVDVTTVQLNGTSSVIFDSLGTPFDANGGALAEPAYVDLNARYRLSLSSETGKVTISTL